MRVDVGSAATGAGATLGVDATIGATTGAIVASATGSGTGSANRGSMAGDGAKISDESRLKISATDDGEVLLFDLP